MFIREREGQLIGAFDVGLSVIREKGEVMDRPTEIRLWEPKESESLEGVFHLEGGLNWMVETEDGSIWLLGSDAEKQLEVLDPEEGQVVHVLYLWDGHGLPTYHVTLHQS